MITRPSHVGGSWSREIARWQEEQEIARRQLQGDLRFVNVYRLELARARAREVEIASASATVVASATSSSASASAVVSATASSSLTSDVVIDISGPRRRFSMILKSTSTAIDIQ